MLYYAQLINPGSKKCGASSQSDLILHLLLLSDLRRPKTELTGKPSREHQQNMFSKISMGEAIFCQKNERIMNLFALQYILGRIMK